MLVPSAAAVAAWVDSELWKLMPFTFHPDTDWHKSWVLHNSSHERQKGLTTSHLHTQLNPANSQLTNYNSVSRSAEIKNALYEGFSAGSHAVLKNRTNTNRTKDSRTKSDFIYSLCCANLCQFVMKMQHVQIQVYHLGNVVEIVQWKWNDWCFRLRFHTVRLYWAGDNLG